MTKRFLVFQHMSWEGPGVHLIRSAENLGVNLEIIEVWHRDIPDLAPYDGLIVLGGGPNADQEKQYPFLRAEKAAICQALAMDKSYLGFCLGHQLLGDVLKSRVGPNHKRSVGFIQGQLSDCGRQHPIFQNLPDTFPLFKWHAQAVLAPVPEQVDILATSADCEVEAISLKGSPHVVGLQFDNHAGSRLDAAAWLEGDREWLSLPPEVDPLLVLADAEKLEPLMGEQFDILFRNFIEMNG
jgi:GMP synthase (glutamine-hydrolysing)